MTKRVVVAMSGGVDSSVAAWLLKQQGYEVIGLFMRTGVHTDVCATDVPQHENGKTGQDAPRRQHKGCCSSLDAADARRVAEILDIPFYALDFSHEFTRIMDYFADEYLAGRTPNPCVVCNNWLKFGRLWTYGRQLAADYIATGHYARIIHGPGGVELHCAVDGHKDQSYVLAGVRRQLLERVLFPLGEFTKPQIRELARQAGLPVHNKPDSQEICFVPDGDYAAFVRRHRPDRNTQGVIVDTSGRILARHPGIENFTIGQRKGLGFAAGQRRYVLAILPADNTVVVGSREECLSAGLVAERFNWLIEEPTQPVRCLVKIRYRAAAVPATVEALPQQRVRIWFDEPQLAVTPGQAAVCYLGTRVLGGGWIAHALSRLENNYPFPR
ncbi:MAG: tRNA 2-thiouridine(34) synthase MnmA [Gemmatales bacterium]|nr:tRNA 2-thiouridine(34) synthase MnmA [Gemmatales bacterium]MDW7994025.1 tRNA 2-thiouridine(34) synthase MnmA [Gemmatales bacterium]